MNAARTDPVHTESAAPPTADTAIMANRLRRASAVADDDDAKSVGGLMVGARRFLGFDVGGR